MLEVGNIPIASYYLYNLDGHCCTTYYKHLALKLL